MRLIAATGLCAVSIVISACARSEAPRAALDFYDDCSARTPSFTAMVACDKERRTADCAARSNCSSDGNAVMQYADSLVQSVSNREMTKRKLEGAGSSSEPLR
jgi:hypothetical protein